MNVQSCNGTAASSSQTGPSSVSSAWQSQIHASLLFSSLSLRSLPRWSKEAICLQVLSSFLALSEASPPRLPQPARTLPQAEGTSFQKREAGRGGVDSNHSSMWWEWETHVRKIRVDLLCGAYSRLLSPQLSLVGKTWLKILIRKFLWEQYPSSFKKWFENHWCIEVDFQVNFKLDCAAINSKASKPKPSTHLLVHMAEACCRKEIHFILLDTQWCFLLSPSFLSVPVVNV